MGKDRVSTLFFVPLPPMMRGFVPWEVLGSTRRFVLEDAAKQQGGQGRQGEEQKRSVLWLRLGERLGKQSLLLATPPPLLPSQGAGEGRQHTGPNPSLFQSLKRHTETHITSSTGATASCLQQEGSRLSTGSAGHVLPDPPAHGLCRRGGTQGPRGW